MVKKSQTQPNQSWPLQKLASYALAGITEIQRAGRHTAAQTYRIGKALHFANLKLIVEGKWNNWLEEQGIPQATAWEAIRLYEAVKDESELEKLTSTEAKIKYGIYHEYMPGEKADSGGGGGGIIQSALTDEDKVNLTYRRLKHAAIDIAEIKKWKPILYSTEVDECLEFCNQITTTIVQQRKKIKRVKQPKGTKAMLEHLDTL